MSSDTRRGRRGLKAVGTSYKLSLLSVVMTTLSVSISGAAVAQTTATPVARPSDDATNQSARERDRILLKRNPIASEYQGNDTPGRFFSAVTDAEGVDFRGQFRLPTGLADAHTAEIEANLSYQDVARDYTPGGSLKLAKGFDRWRLQFRAQKNSLERIVDFYEARWLAIEAPGAEGQQALLLGFPRYSQDSFDTTSTNMQWRADYVLSEQTQFSYEGMSTNYDDIATRNRLEYQIGAGEIESAVLDNDDTTLSDVGVSQARIRRYFHRMETARDIHRHRLGMNYETDTSAFEAGLYYSRWVNERLWLPWNFVDQGLSANYSIDNPYLPTTTVTNADVFNTNESWFANYRPTLTTTTDTDYAFITDWSQQFHLAGRPVWLGSGVTWRNKERNNENYRSVFTATDDRFSLTEVLGNHQPVSIMEGRTTIPAGMDLLLGEPYLAANPGQFNFNPAQSFLESIQDIYTSEETVSSAYVDAYQQRDAWFWRLGLRFEKTETHTRGAVSGPTEAGIAELGDPITAVTVAGQTIEETFGHFDAAFVEGGNRYEHWLPSLELRYQLSSSTRLKFNYFEQLMRPQYFDTVRYRRINPPTRTITEGSPDLLATTIVNWFAGIEYQHEQVGKLYAGLYYNDIADFFYDSRVTEELEGIVYDVTRVENGTDGFIRGLQTYWSQQFTQTALALIEIKASYTYSDTEANLANRTIAMPERAEHRLMVNLLVKHNQWRYSTNLAWQSEALDDVGADAQQDTIREKVLVWDQSFSWRFNQHLSARFSLNNILNYPDRSYLSEQKRIINNLYSGTTVKLSLRYTF
ncbi:TonB-dependent receptor [uncultured Alteromonas sp.]|uniref:TonB-dependent receptor domain-containing protein n=1 Tax=uncultured Alteromonas sp. TaxID=179113 RepID=UPI0025FF0B17|nr:TonB-dependent receptor [uncultured Alteromonas sp.]